jgi:lysozyme family protein
MSFFEKSLRFVLEHETVYAKGHYGDMNFAVSENVAGDAGGLTKFGIDQRSHPDIDIENLTVEQASAIYREEYWDRNHCGDMPWPICAVHFDNCVNMGPRQAVKLLQREVGAKDDGAFGPATKAAMLSACEVRGAEDVAIQICSQKQEFYEKLVEQKPHLQKFKKGWLNRVNDLREVIV